MRHRLVTAAVVGAAAWAVPATALAQEEERTIQDVVVTLVLPAITLAGFVVFMLFALVYYLIAVAARNRRYAVQTVAVPAAQPVGVAAPAAAVAAPAAVPAAAPAAPAAAPAPATAPPPAPAAPAPAPAAAAPGALPRIDPNQLPDGIDAVARGRLKKLAVFQERGQAPPRDLIENLKTILEQIAGEPIDVDAAASSAPAAQAPPAAAPAAAPAPPAEQAPAEPAPAAAEPAPPPPAAQPAAAEAPPAAPAPAPAAAPAAPVPAADTSGIPRIDVNNLPSGIDAVARGRLKKLAVLQERGQAPPADLIESLKPFLDQIKGS